MKKVFNWLGWSIIIIYIIIFFLLCMIGIYFNNNGFIQYRNILYSIATIMFIAGFAMLPIWYDWALGRLLPCQKAIATVILKENSISRVYDAEGPTRSFVKNFLTFELSDGKRFAFRVKSNIFCTILLGESGTLTYKEQGKHAYFISFERQL